MCAVGYQYPRFPNSGCFFPSSNASACGAFADPAAIDTPDRPPVTLMDPGIRDENAAFCGWVTATTSQACFSRSPGSPAAAPDPADFKAFDVARSPVTVTRAFPETFTWAVRRR